MKEKKIIEEEEDEKDYIYKDLDDNKINYFPNGIIKEFTTGTSILKYKLGIYWIPILLFSIFMFIIVNTLFESALFDDNLIRTELVGAIVAIIIMFACYFIVDFIYQWQLCKDQDMSKNVMNSVFNSIHITSVVGLGYIFGMFISDYNLTDIEIAQQNFDKQVFENNPMNDRFNSSSGSNFMTGIPSMSMGISNQTSNELYYSQEAIQNNQQDLLRLMLSSSQHNNIFMAILFYFIGMAYWNPYYDEKCSRTKICRKEKVYV